MSENQHKKSRPAADALNTTHPQADKDRLQTLEAHVENMSAEDFDVEIFREYTDLLQKTQTLVQNFDPMQAENVFFEKHAQLIDSSDNEDNTDTVIHMPKRLRVWKRTLLIAACVAVLLAAFSMTAVGASIFEKIARWTDDTFSLESDTQRSDHAPTIRVEPTITGQADPESVNKDSESTGDMEVVAYGNYPTSQLSYASLAEALKADGVSSGIVPGSIPVRFELAEITKTISDIETVYKAQYHSKELDSVLLMSLGVHSEPANGAVLQKDEKFVEVYSVHGTDYYIMSNLERTTATAISGSHELIISGDVTAEEVRQMIDSAYEGD